MDLLLEALHRISAGRVLDACTGRGEFVDILVENLKDFSEIVAVDLSEKAGKALSDRYSRPDIRFMLMDAGRLDFRDGEFDTVCISNSLHHLTEVGQTLRELLRVLKPGGLFMVNEMVCDGQTETQLSHVLMHHWSARIDALCGITHNTTFERRQVMDVVAALGLEKWEAIEYIFPDEDSPELRESLAAAIDRSAARLEGRPDPEGLREQGDTIRQRILQIGLSSATELLIMGIKPR